MQNRTFSPEELFEILTRERGWAFNPGGQVVWDERRTGAAAGGRRAGFAVFALIQVTDRGNRSLALARGEHLRYGDRHAEQKAITALERHMPAGAQLRGGTMTVVLDQVPCPPGRRNCFGLLESYARQHGLRLEIWLPTRPRVVGTGDVSPRTAAMSSMRTTVPEWTLKRYP